jgi:hypothetical protein
MSDYDEIFIKRQHRPDLRSALTGDDVENALDGLAILLPIHYIPRSKDCSGDKSDKSDKKKEIGKDDKSAPRNAAGSPTGPVTDNSLQMPLETFDTDVIDQAVFS